MSDDTFVCRVKSVSKQYQYENPHGQIYPMRVATVVDRDGKEYTVIGWHHYASVMPDDGVRVMWQKSPFTGMVSYFIVGITPSIVKK